MSRLLIFLHGFGSNGDNLVALAQHMATQVGGTTAAPDAPHGVDHGGSGRQWFSIAGVTEANRPARVAAAREEFDAVLTKIIAAQNMADQLHQVALIGFSQGAIMALDAVASGRWPVAAAVAFASRLASPLPLTPALATPVLLLHGTADTVMPFALAKRAEAQLRDAGVAVTLHQLAGVGHSISPEGASLATQFLQDRLG